MIINGKSCWPVRVFGSDGKEYDHLTTLDTETGRACQLATLEGEPYLNAGGYDLESREIYVPLPVRFEPRQAATP